MTEPNQAKETQLDTRQRSMVILWSASVITIGLYCLLTVFTPGPETEDEPGQVISVVLLAIGISLAVISVVVKRRFFKHAEEKQSLALVQTGLVAAIALCDGIGLLGVLDHFITGYDYYFILFIIAVVALLFHFPRRSQWAAASYRQTRAN